jgi:hypothetical protein
MSSFQESRARDFRESAAHERVTQPAPPPGHPKFRTLYAWKFFSGYRRIQETTFYRGEIEPVVECFTRYLHRVLTVQAKRISPPGDFTSTLTTTVSRLSGKKTWVLENDFTGELITTEGEGEPDNHGIGPPGFYTTVNPFQPLVDKQIDDLTDTHYLQTDPIEPWYKWEITYSEPYDLDGVWEDLKELHRQVDVMVQSQASGNLFRVAEPCWHVPKAGPVPRFDPDIDPFDTAFELDPEPNTFSYVTYGADDEILFPDPANGVAHHPLAPLGNVHRLHESDVSWCDHKAGFLSDTRAGDLYTAADPWDDPLDLIVHHDWPIPMLARTALVNFSGYTVTEKEVAFCAWSADAPVADPEEWFGNPQGDVLFQRDDLHGYATATPPLTDRYETPGDPYLIS